MIKKTLISGCTALSIAALAACTATAQTNDENAQEDLLQRKLEVQRLDAGNKNLERVPDDLDIVAGVDPAVPEELLNALRRDAAERAEATTEAVTVTAARVEEWPDGAMGCPEPGQVYTQMRTNGYRVLVKVGPRTFDYRADKEHRFRLCDYRAMQKVGPKN